MKAILTSLTAAVLITGCVSTHPDSIMPKQEVNKYKKYSCADLETKANEITSQTIKLKKQLKNKADINGVMLTVGLLVAWPALLAIQGDDKDTTELYSKIKGELLNIEEADMLNNCNIQFSKDTLSIVNIH